MRQLAAAACAKASVTLAQRALGNKAHHVDTKEAIEALTVDSNSRDMAPVCMALLLRELPRLRGYRERMQEHLAAFTTGLHGQSQLALPDRAVLTAGLNFFPVRVFATSRYALGSHLAARGIESTWLYYPLHKLARYRSFAPAVPLPRSEAAWREVVCVPARGWHSRRQVAHVIAALRTFGAEAAA